MYLLHRVKSVQPMAAMNTMNTMNTVKPTQKPTDRQTDDYCLLVEFDNGVIKQYDVKPLLDKWDAFKPLSTVTGLFQQVKVDQGGYGISWNEDIDLSSDELYHNGTTTVSQRREGIDPA